MYLMKLFQTVILLAQLVTQVTSKELTDVFTDFISLTFQESGDKYIGPSTPTWFAKLGWSLNGSYAKPGDTFSLHLPYVFQFITDQSYFTVLAAGTVYATCDFNPGELLLSYSTIDCVVSNALMSNIEAEGTITFPFMFNSGGSASLVDLASANIFTTGYNTITFQHCDKNLTIDAYFEKTNIEKSGVLASGRIIPSLGKISHLLIGKVCVEGHKSGILEISTNDDSVTFDCDSINVSITNRLNDWNLPTNAEPLDYTKECSPKNVKVSFDEIPAGYRPFLHILFESSLTSSVFLKYTTTYRNKKGGMSSVHTYKNWNSYQNYPPVSDGTIIVLTTKTGTQSTTEFITLPYDPEKDLVKTIQVFVPIPTTTTTLSYHGISTYYTTISATIGETAIIVVNEPYHETTTITTCWEASGTTTYADIAENHSIDTVFIKTEYLNPTTTTTVFSDIQELTTIIEKQKCGNIDTEYIVYPYNPFTTTTIIEDDVEVLTTYTDTDSHGGTDTVVVVYPPNPTTTTTRFETVEELTTMTRTNVHGGTDTVVIIFPNNPFTTISIVHDEIEDPIEDLTSGIDGGSDTVLISSTDSSDIEKTVDTLGSITNPTSILPQVSTSRSSSSTVDSTTSYGDDDDDGDNSSTFDTSFEDFSTESYISSSIDEVERTFSSEELVVSMSDFEGTDTSETLTSVDGLSSVSDEEFNSYSSATRSSTAVLTTSKNVNSTVIESTGTSFSSDSVLYSSEYIITSSFPGKIVPKLINITYATSLAAPSPIYSNAIAITTSNVSLPQISVKTAHIYTSDENIEDPSISTIGLYSSIAVVSEGAHVNCKGDGTEEEVDCHISGTTLLLDPIKTIHIQDLNNSSNGYWHPPSDNHKSGNTNFETPPTEKNGNIDEKSNAEVTDGEQRVDIVQQAQDTSLPAVTLIESSLLTTITDPKYRSSILANIAYESESFSHANHNSGILQYEDNSSPNHIPAYLAFIISILNIFG